MFSKQELLQNAKLEAMEPTKTDILLKFVQFYVEIGEYDAAKLKVDKFIQQNPTVMYAYKIKLRILINHFIANGDELQTKKFLIIKIATHGKEFLSIITNS